MACFPALNTLKTKAITLINAPAHKVVKKPIVIIDSVRRGGGTKDMQEIKQRGKGVSFHPRLLVNAMPYSKVSINQSLVDFFNEEVDEDKKAQDNPAFYKDETFLPKSYNTITHVDKTGSKITANVESQDDSTCTKGANRASNPDIYIFKREDLYWKLNYQ